MPPKKLVPVQPCRLPVDFTYHDLIAIQAVAKGSATEEQQQKAMRWIIERASEFYEVHHFESGLDNAFSNGRRFVGRELVNLINMPPNRVEALRKSENKPTP